MPNTRVSMSPCVKHVAMKSKASAVIPFLIFSLVHLIMNVVEIMRASPFAHKSHVVVLNQVDLCWFRNLQCPKTIATALLLRRMAEAGHAPC